MKFSKLALISLGLFMLAGCASSPKTADIPLQLGMSRQELRWSYGEPLRITPVTGGGEDWYYRFVSWKTRPVYGAGTSEEFGEETSYVSVGLEGSHETEERPIHVSAEGVVIKPLPHGKVVQP